MKKLFLTLLCLSMIDLGHANQFRHWSDWTTSEKLEYAAYTALNYTDFAQTEICVSQYPKCKEANPFLGSKPNDATIAAAFLVGQIGYYYLIGVSEMDSRSAKSRPLLMALKISIIISNDNQGIKISKVW